MTQLLIPWHPSPHGGPLGRSVDHDPRSRAHGVQPVAALRSGLWVRHVPVYDQGTIGRCTAEAICGAVSTGKFTRRIRSQRTTTGVYHDETLIDGFGPPYPPNDRGSSGLAACKVAKARGWIGSYLHGFSLTDTIAGLQDGPGITGINWYDSFDQPNAGGLCDLTAGAQVRGGHEVCLVGVDLEAKTVRFVNSWGPGWGDRGYGVWTFDTFTRLLAEQGDVTFPKAA